MKKEEILDTLVGLEAAYAALADEGFPIEDTIELSTLIEETKKELEETTQ
tara:strand:- start:56 stop:205 length:150 start_codon:yes stop_codon:yes gene_type:complete